MHNEIFQINNYKVEKNNQSVDFPPFVAKFRNSLWIFGVHSWLFGIADRSIASFTDGYLSALELIHLFTASFFFMGWLFLKPEEILQLGDVDTIKRYRSDANYSYQYEQYLHTTHARMLELQEQHMISQEYILPFPYVCQIYHLLNLKHLETIHGFSLNNLKVIKVSQFQPTIIGGILKFQTVADSPLNALRIWRPPIVEVELILHTPYTVELSIPVYGDKRITVIFNVLPLSANEHKLFIDIYSNLLWPKPLLQILLHFASCLTLFEDLPYLRKLAERKVHRLFNLSRASNHETMSLFRRFVDLYGSSIEPFQPIKAIEANDSAIA
jgi:hypothetical protein